VALETQQAGDNVYIAYINYKMCIAIVWKLQKLCNKSRTRAQIYKAASTAILNAPS